ncbi:MAG: hypothetical protein IKC69_06660, partial [Clostridia bacterium]|nr:hypothetical protein [Clostridia bacterium]
VFLFFFWPVGAYLLYASSQTKNELRSMGYDPRKVKNTIYKKKSTFALICGVILLFIGIAGTVAEIQNIANGEPDPFGICIGIMFIVIGIIVCKRKKTQAPPPPPTTVNLNEQFGQFFDPMQNQYKNK